ncbi:MAG TPA: oxygenase MpaB family protein, partial [Acidimicrobiales bacterium]|nr:oxygenase MpaB family protein [Acidimicrobiales bacterium]
MSNGMMGLTREVTAAVRTAQVEPWDRRIMPEHVEDVLRSHFGDCATDLSVGNTEVFAEIAPVAATFLASFGDGGDLEVARRHVRAACRGAPEFDGINHLDRGFTLWCDSRSESDPTRRSQLVLAGSLHLGAHEQHHLQEAIAGSMDMGLDRSLTLLKGRLATALSCPPDVEKVVDDLLRPLARETGRLWGELTTELLGTIELPDGSLRLDEDVPPLSGEPFVGVDLRPVVVPELRDLLGQFSRADPEGRGSRAENWVDLGDRMNFITNLFVSRHHRRSLFEPPLDPAALSAIEADRVPDGPQGPPSSGTSSTGRQRTSPPRSPGQPLSRGVAMFSDAYIEHLRQLGDPPADAAVSAFFEATDAGHEALYRRLATSSARTAADEGLPGICEFVETIEPWPDWADPDLVRQGQDVFGEFGPQIGMGLFMASLPSDYGFAKGVQALARTARLTRNPKRRYVETGQMIIDAMTPGALDPGARGYRTVRHVRLMHAAVRHVLAHLHEMEEEGGPSLPPWDRADGLPISQLQLLGTLFSFGVQGVEALRRSGVSLSDQRAEAYIHTWNLVGYQIGILDELLPLSWDDSRTLWDQRRAGPEYAPTAEGKELTAAAIECMRELFGLSWVPGLPASGIRFYLGDRTADLLGVPRSDWTRMVFELMRRTDWVYGYGLDRLPGMGPLSARLGRRIWEGFERYGRDGLRPSFEVTDELKASWAMGS